MMMDKRSWCIFCFQGVLALIVAGAWGVFLVRYYDLQVGHGATMYTPPAAPEAPVRNAIVYVGTDEHIWILHLDSSQPPQRLSSRYTGFSQPTLSPDGKFIAYLGTAHNRRSIFLNTIHGAGQCIIHSQNDTRPFYVMWSPQSDRLGYLMSVDNQVELRHMLIGAPESNQMASRGDRVFWNWAPVGVRIIANKDGLLQLNALDDATVAEVEMGRYRIQAPVWDAANETTYIVLRDEAHQNYLYRASVDFETIEEITPLPGSCRMALSPDGQHLALLVAREQSISPFWSNAQGEAYLVHTELGELQSLIMDEVVALFFSPDSTKIALLLRYWGHADQQYNLFGGEEITYLDPEVRSMLMYQWVLYDIEADVLTPLMVFNASRRFHVKLANFDQYHHSHRFWSPDSRYLVMTDQDNAANGRVWIIDTQQEEAPRRAAEGTFAVWSWE